MRMPVRILVADDEEIECRALEHKIRTLFPEMEVLGSVGDGLSLLEAVTEKRPDIAIVDINMPGLGGLDAVEFIRARGLQTKIIINSSYSDFPFTQKALQLGASDYLLKPDTGGDLKRALRKVLGELQEEREKQETRGKDEHLREGFYRVAAQKWLLSLLLQSPDEECFSLLCEAYPGLSGGGFFSLWQSLGEGRLSQIEEAFSPLCTCLGLETEEGTFLYLAWEGKAADLLEAGIRALRGKGLSFRVGVSSFTEDPACFTEGIREAKRALAGKEKEGVYFFSRSPQSGERVLTPALLSQLALHLEAGRVQEACDLTFPLLSGRDVPAGKALMVCLGAELSGYLERRHPSFRRPLPYKDLGSAQGEEEIREWVRKAFTLLAEALHLEEGENAYVDRAIAYICENMTRDISLEDVAGVLDISPFYLSRLFTQTRDFSFMELLTDLRLREAVRLTQESSLGAREISERLGYASPKYFARVFKKGTGMTVGEMRELL